MSTMNTAETQIKLRFMAREYTCVLNPAGKLTIYEGRGEPFIRRSDEGSIQAGAAMIAALLEYSQLQKRLFTRALDRDYMWPIGMDEFPTHVAINTHQGVTFAFVCAQTPERVTVGERLIMNGEPWINEGELEHRKFWLTLAGALHNARRRIALVKTVSNSHRVA